MIQWSLTSCRLIRGSFLQCELLLSSSQGSRRRRYSKNYRYPAERGSRTIQYAYSILGCHPSADLEDVKSAFLRRAHEFHPDKSGGDAEAFIRCREALECIIRSLQHLRTRDFQATESGSGEDGNASQDWVLSGGEDDWLGFRMDEATRLEVISLYNKVATKGLLRGWEVEMANYHAKGGHRRQRVQEVTCPPPLRRQRRR